MQRNERVCHPDTQITVNASVCCTAAERHENLQGRICACKLAGRRPSGRSGHV